jgi:hypothetical protein
MGKRYASQTSVFSHVGTLDVMILEIAIVQCRKTRDWTKCDSVAAETGIVPSIHEQTTAVILHEKKLLARRAKVE